MSFIKNLKNAFGFSDNPNSNDIDDELSYDDQDKREPYINPFKPATSIEPVKPKPIVSQPTELPITPSQVKTPAVSYELPEGFLTSIIAIVNANLPQIVKDCIDIEAEKKAITQSLGSHFKSAIDDIHQAAVAKANAAWENDRADIAAKLAQATQAADESARRADEAKQKCQVEESKRKALKEQAASLEQRVHTLEAEHEQYVIENKSLLNKMKVMQVYADDAATYKDLAEQNEKALAALRTEIEAKQKEIDDAKALANQAMHDATEASRQAKDAIDAAKKELDDAHAEIENVKLDAAIAREETAKSKAELEAKNTEIEALKAELAEANTNLELMAEIERQLQHLEDFKAQKNSETKELTTKIQDLQAHNESITATAQANAAECAKLKEELQAAKSEAEQNVLRVMQERDAAIKRLSMERAEALKQAADDNAKLLEEKEHLLDIKEDEKIRAIEAKDAEINSLTTAKNEEIDRIRHQMEAELDKARKEYQALAKERDRIAGNFATEQRDRKSDVAFYEQKIKFLTSDQKRVEAELRDEIKMLKDIMAQKDAQAAKLQAANASLPQTALPADSNIDNDIADAVSQTFGFDSRLETLESSIQGPSAAVEAEPEVPKIPNDIFDNDSFTDDSIDATFDTSTNAPAEPATETHTDEPTMDELDDIDWLMPTPPSRPEPVALPDDEEEKPATKPAEEAPQKPDAQMSLF
ncbi:MAG: hypothetical protein ACI4UN_01300 [Muribaculaceae bacterium]